MFRRKLFIPALIASITLNSITVSASPYKLCDDFNNYMKQSAPQYYENNEFYMQGINLFGYHGTCSEASEANVMNLMFGTDYTEQDFLDLAIKLGFCTTGTDNVYVNGGQTPVQMVNVLQYMGGTTGFPVTAQYKVTSQVPDAEECARLMEEGIGVIMAVDSNILWGFTPEQCAAYGIQYYASDHWIVLKRAVYEDGYMLSYKYTVSGNLSRKSVSDNSASSNTISKNMAKKADAVSPVSVNKVAEAGGNAKARIGKGTSGNSTSGNAVIPQRMTLSQYKEKRGKLVGFDVLDSSGSGVKYTDAATLNAMIFGPTRTEIPYCACVLVYPPGKVPEG